jgi:hypothetical protein
MQPLEESERTGSGLRLRRRLLNQISCELRHPPPVPAQPTRAISPAGRPSPTQYYPLPQHHHPLPRHYHPLPRITTHCHPLPPITTHCHPLPRMTKKASITQLSRTPCRLPSPNTGAGAGAAPLSPAVVFARVAGASRRFRVLPAAVRPCVAGAAAQQANAGGCWPPRRGAKLPATGTPGRWGGGGVWCEYDAVNPRCCHSPDV